MFRAGTLRSEGSALGLTLALAFAGAGCATTGRFHSHSPGRVAARPIQRVTPRRRHRRRHGPTHATADGYAIAGTALGLRGAPYRNGGSDPSGFDCSGFIWFVFGQNGIRVPRTVSEQAREGIEVRPDAVAPGDLVFFSTQSPGPSHVGMAIGGDEFVHAPSSRGEVRVERLSAAYWASRYVGARRIQ